MAEEVDHVADGKVASLESCFGVLEKGFALYKKSLVHEEADLVEGVGLGDHAVEEEVEVVLGDDGATWMEGDT